MSFATRTANDPRAIWASPKTMNYDLGEAMDNLYGVGGWDSTTDASPAATIALQALRARYGRGHLWLTGSQSFQFDSPLAAADTAGHFLRGYGSLHSKVDLNFGSGAFWSTSGTGGWNAGGIKNVSFLLMNGFGNSNTVVHQSIGDATYQGDQAEYDDIYATATGDSYYLYGALWDGRARTAPQGIRNVNIRNWQQFRCHSYSFGFYNAVQFCVDNLGTYVGSGTGMNIIISGGGTGSTNTTQMGVTNLVCQGELNLTAATHIRLSGQAATVAAATSFDYYDVSLRTASFAGSVGANGRWFIY